MARWNPYRLDDRQSLSQDIDFSFFSVRSMRSWIGLVHLSTCDVDRGGGTIGVFLCPICSLSPPIVPFMTADGFSGASMELWGFLVSAAGAKNH